MQTWLAEVEARLVQTEGLLCSANKKSKAIEERATSTVVQVVEVYKELEDFENDISKARVYAYIFDFNDYKDKVAQAYPKLDLSGIFRDKAVRNKEDNKMEQQLRGRMMG